MMTRSVLKAVLFVVCCSLVLGIQISGESVVPEEFSWDNNGGVSYLSPARNQNFPYSCNSGWAFATVGMIEARIKIQRKGASPDVSLSTQVLLSCDTFDNGCLGGEPSNALRYIMRNNITDETCHSYMARGYTEGEKCTAQSKCQACYRNGDCKSQGNSKIYSVGKYGAIGGQKQMMSEIYSNGPIACGLSVTNQLKSFTNSSAVFEDKTGARGTNHYVMVYGWGVDESQKKYWLVRNSWGSFWGDNGNFKILRGDNNLGIQNLCYWTSLVDTWTNDVRNQTVPPSSSQSTLVTNTLYSKIAYPLPPYLTSSKSVLTPRHCESSWAFSIIQMFRDRIRGNSKGRLNVDFSVQGLINCGIGHCNAETDPFNALSYISKYGMVEESCQGYKGEAPAKENCTGIYNCATCSGTAFASNCTEVKNFKRWKIHDYGVISGEKDMMGEISSYGPIVCGIDKNATKFQNYEGGILSEITISPKINHYVEVVGYGSEGGQNYWIGRNFWGTAWGEEGFFRIARGGNNLGIEKKCYWANFVL